MSGSEHKKLKNHAKGIHIHVLHHPNKFPADIITRKNVMAI